MSPRFIDVRELVRSNRLFRRLAAALRMTDAEARESLCTAMAWAGTSPPSLGPIELRFMVLRIETDVLSTLSTDEAQVCREALERLLVWVTRELANEESEKNERSALAERNALAASSGAGPSYARLA